MADNDPDLRRAGEVALAVWAELVARPDPALDLAEAALCVALPTAPDLDVPRYLGRLDALAAGVAGGLEGDEEPHDILLATTSFLFEECGFRGDREDYYDSSNSHLHEVLERRRGIPITLSILLIAVAERLGLDAFGIGFPAHFLVGAHVPDRVVVDPFRRGQQLDLEDCARLLRQVTAGAMQFTPALLRPASKRQILARVLRNLKSIHARDGDLWAALLDCERIAMLSPGDLPEQRDRGLLRLANGRLRGAVTDLRAYLEALPDATDAERVKAHLDQARQRLYRLN